MHKKNFLCSSCFARSRDWVYESAGYASDKFNCLSKHDISVLMETLEEMAEVFDESVDWDSKEGGNSVRE